MTTTLLLVIGVIVLALIFDFLNGFHDAANAIATIVVSKTLTPLQAVILAGFANFIGYFTFGVAVAKMIGKGVVHIDYITLQLLLGALSGAIFWNIFTWVLGLPTSSSHALIGGLIGSGIAANGYKVVIVSGVTKIFSFIIIAPLLGLFGALFFTIIVFWIFRKVPLIKANKILKNLQLISATFYSIGHGTNDAQKSMGIIGIALYAGHLSSSFEIPKWVVLSCYSAMALGTFFGGWRIVKTMGTSITKIGAMEGFCAETASACVLLATQHFGIPVSTTHVIAGAIMGVGTVEHARSVRWVTARKILWAWILTIPCSAAFSAMTYLILSFCKAHHLINFIS
ncbi:MAG: inorganic phosphate transporter [Desulfobacterales bacterium]|nr:inorganic phosphate transporter [Desulfobacterales bacterium]MBF0398424.1 inorganic phosphate transporter [Desulfobacterales bacterium]